MPLLLYGNKKSMILQLSLLFFFTRLSLFQAEDESWSSDHQKHIRYELSLTTEESEDIRLALEQKFFDQYGEKYEMPDDCE